jgi:hypothetical protein
MDLHDRVAHSMPCSPPYFPHCQLWVVVVLKRGLRRLHHEAEMKWHTRAHPFGLHLAQKELVTVAIFVLTYLLISAIDTVKPRSDLASGLAVPRSGLAHWCAVPLALRVFTKTSSLPPGFQNCLVFQWVVHPQFMA